LAVELGQIDFSHSGKEAEFLAELHGLRPASGPQFVEDAAGMGLDRVLADEELLGDLTVAQTTGDQFEDLELAAGDAEVFSFLLVGDEWFSNWGRDVLHDDCLLGLGELEAEPDSENGKGGGDEAAVDLERMLDDEEPVLSPLEHGDQDATEQAVDQDVALHGPGKFRIKIIPVSRRRQEPGEQDERGG